MLKKYTLGLVLAISVTALAGCGSTASTSADKGTSSNASSSTSSAAFKDGDYKASYDKADEHGYKAVVTVSVKGGKIAKVDFDNYDKDGKRKSEDAKYEEAMKKQKNIGPKEYTPKLNQQLVDSQDASKVDGVTGATQSSKEFKELSKAALDKAKKGDTSETILKAK